MYLKWNIQEFKYFLLFIFIFYFKWTISGVDMLSLAVIRMFLYFPLGYFVLILLALLL